MRRLNRSLLVALIMTLPAAPIAVWAQATPGSSPTTTDVGDAAIELPELPEKYDEPSVVQYLQELDQVPPPAATREGVAQLMGAIGKRLDDLLTMPLADGAAIQAVGFRSSVWDALVQLGANEAREKRAAWLDQLGQSERALYAEMASGLRIMTSLSDESIALGRADAWLKLSKDTVDYLKKSKASDFALMVGLRVAESSEMAAPANVASSIHRELASVLRNSDQENASAIANQLEGVARRKELPGNEMLISGQTPSGDTFDLASLQGKVVIVDFWATWCPLCIEAFPVLEAVYDKYKNDGLEIVGVNIDDSKQLWTGYLESHPLPWVHIQNLGENSEHPNADRYGITGIPFLAVVGRDGKVVRTRVAPQELDGLIESLVNP